MEHFETYSSRDDRDAFDPGDLVQVTSRIGLVKQDETHFELQHKENLLYLGRETIMDLGGYKTMSKFLYGDILCYAGCMDPDATLSRARLADHLFKCLTYI